MALLFGIGSRMKPRSNLSQSQRRAAHRVRSRTLLGVERLENRVLMAGLENPDTIVTPANISLPAVGVPFVDTNFGTTIRRVSDSSEHGGMESHIYSQLQAFSTDSELLLLVGPEGYRVRRVSDFAQVTEPTWDWSAPRWQPAERHTIVDFGTNPAGDVTVRYHHLDTGVTETVFTFPSQYDRVSSNESFEDLSLDGHWMNGMLWRDDGQPALFTLDLENRRLGTEINVHGLYTGPCQPDPEWGEVTPNWVGVSPLSRNLVVAWNRDGADRCSGVETFDLHTGAFVGRAFEGHQHGDLGVMPDGASEVYATFEVYIGPGVGLHALPGTIPSSPGKLIRPLDWGNMDHISGRGPNGEFLVTAGEDSSNGWTAFEGEVFVQHTDGRVERLAHHRSTRSDYWVQPRASLSRDGRYAIFASDWGRDTGGRGDPYIVDLGAGTPPPQPQLSIGDATIREGDTGTVLTQFVVRLSSPSDRPVSVAYATSADAATAGNDFLSRNGTLTFVPGETQKTISVPVVGDRRDEFDETFFVRLTNAVDAVFADAEGLGTIVDNDPLPQLSVNRVPVTERDTESVVTTLTVRLSAASGKQITVQYATSSGTATAGSDYTATRGTLTFQPGETSKTVPVTVLGDLLDEANETLFLNLASATNATLSATPGRVTIGDNDPPPLLSIRNVSVAEGQSGTMELVFTVSLSVESGQRVTVNYATADGTARAGRDYQSSRGTLTFAPRETTKTIKIIIFGDGTIEGDETFFVRLRQASNATIENSFGIGTILNDD